jgi:hypothetical protein
VSREISKRWSREGLALYMGVEETGMDEPVSDYCYRQYNDGMDDVGVDKEVS